MATAANGLRKLTGPSADRDQALAVVTLELPPFAKTGRAAHVGMPLPATRRESALSRGCQHPPVEGGHAACGVP